MKVRVSGKQVEIGAALPEEVRGRLETAVLKHFDGGADAHVVFSHDGPFFRADVTVHLDTGAVMKGEGDGKDAYLAFDSSLERLEKQLRRYKRKLKNHHDKNRAPKGQPA
ncbi:MAG TPA: ribosome-associated translation inhibitor RaiA [Rhizomicrobium sp.]|jgi:ribosomal subunit interface protein|nr:ribosome-associated translation inhibitor RaiA [Rhizomicrobium sp.]